jgi:hypothetical protein
MDVNILDHGKTIICMVMVSILGKMEEDMKGTMKWTRNMDTESTPGRMVEGMKAIG